MGSERRVHKRIYFHRDEHITVKLSIPGDNEKMIQAKIMNLSQEGMAISYQSEHAFTVMEGMVLSIKEVYGADDLKFIENKMVEARWVLEDRTLEVISVGCKFYGFNEGNKNDIKQAIAFLASRDMD